MNLENLITTLLTATIPSILTFLATRKFYDSKIKQVEIKSNAEIKLLKLDHEHEIEKLQAEHNHESKMLEFKHAQEIEKLNIEHQLHKDTQSDEMSNKFAAQLVSGDLNLKNCLNNLNELVKFKETIDNLNK